MLKLKKYSAILILLNTILIFSIKFADSRKLSFKESLTAYAEASESSENETSFQNGKNEGSKVITSLHPLTSHYDKNLVEKRLKKEEKLLSSPSNVQNTWVPFSNRSDNFSLWKLTTNFRTPENPTPLTEYDKRSQNLSPNAVYFDGKKFEKLYKSNLYPMNTNLVNSMNINLNNAKTDNGKTGDPYQPRNKKEVAGNPGLKDVLWNTATALWSVNTEHLIPTFLHTKTGGKLSLIRDSIFKPISILSQYKSGVQAINNEKMRNLARLSTGGWGRPPPSEVVVVKVQPQNSHFMTLARYIFRLTKHTAITKWRLKRALLDLQVRAARKLYRILTSKNVSQKIATIQILTNAAFNGKRAVLRTLQGILKPRTTTPKPTGPYAGADNAANVDITYSSLNKLNNGQPWMTQYAPPPTQKSPATWPNNYMAPTQKPPPASWNNYHAPPAQTHSPAPWPHYYAPPNTSPASNPWSNYYTSTKKPFTTSWMNFFASTTKPPPTAPTSTYNFYSSPSASASAGSSFISGSAPEPSTNFLPPALPQQQFPQASFFVPSITFTTESSGQKSSYDPLIEAPSYANVLKTMGINPVNLESSSTRPSTTIIQESAIPSSSGSATLEPPNPTVIYYSSGTNANESEQNEIGVTHPHKINAIEESAISVEYHSSSATAPATTTYKLPATTPATAFRKKLLELMNLVPQQ